MTGITRRAAIGLLAAAGVLLGSGLAGGFLLRDALESVAGRRFIGSSCGSGASPYWAVTPKRPDAAAEGASGSGMNEIGQTVREAALSPYRRFTRAEASRGGLRHIVFAGHRGGFISLPALAWLHGVGCAVSMIDYDGRLLFASSPAGPDRRGTANTPRRRTATRHSRRAPPTTAQ